MPARILLIEDDPEAAEQIERTLRAPPDRCDVVLESSGTGGLERLLAQPIDCVLLDYRLPDGDGLRWLRALRQKHPAVPVVMVTGAGSEAIAVEAMKCGASDYLVKHGRYLDGVPVVVREALGCRDLLGAEPSGAATGEKGRLSAEGREFYRRAGIIGESRAIASALALAERAAATRATVLLEGETGTGKELFARAIHRRGPRGTRPLVVQNCAALPEPLLESELFGHARGAFTSADRERRGLFEQATGGTLFLDEISETSLAFQAKLLRVLQEGEVRPLGASTTRTIDVRVIAASNQDLRAATREGRFRVDLYHRLRVFPIRIPPLRERREDTRVLALHFLARLAADEGVDLVTLDPETLRLMERYAWPGNVRELHNEVHRLVLSAESGERIGPASLAPWFHDRGRAPGPGRPLRDIVHDVELAAIQTRLRENDYRRAATARSLGITREALWQKLRRFGMTPPRPG